MSITPFHTLLVGIHFNPPAKALLQFLPQGCALRLEFEPENPYDENAIKCWAPSGSIDAELDPSLEALTMGMGYSAQDIREAEWWVLGHVAANGGKPLLKAGLLKGNLEVGEAMRSGEAKFSLGFAGDGSPLIMVGAEQ